MAKRNRILFTVLILLQAILSLALLAGCNATTGSNTLWTDEPDIPAIAASLPGTYRVGLGKMTLNADGSGSVEQSTGDDVAILWYWDDESDRADPSSVLIEISIHDGSDRFINSFIMRFDKDTGLNSTVYFPYEQNSDGSRGGTDTIKKLR
jgi:hypothetical protein